MVQFAKNLGLSREGSRQIEIAEADESITLKRLRRAADALNCDLAYALIPRESVGTSQSETSSNDLAKRVAHTMMLEGQDVDIEVLRRRASRS